MNMTVTGGAGFIGSHLTDELIELGHDVTVLDDFSEGDRSVVNPKAHLVIGDIRDRHAVKTAVAGADVVFHLAAKRAVHRSIDDPEYTTDVNVLGTLNVFQAAVDGGVQRVVFASSSSVYGDQVSYPTAEDAPLNPRSPYSVSKLYGENLAAMHARTSHTEFISLRYFNVYGPRQTAGQYAAVVPLFMERLLNGKRPEVHGDGEQRRDFTYIADAVRATIQAGSLGGWEGAVNVGGGRPHTINDVLEKLAMILGVEANPYWTSRRRGDTTHTGADMRLAREVLNYEPKWRLTEGLEATVEDWIGS